jgi:hypothetical protein
MIYESCWSPLLPDIADLLWRDLTAAIATTFGPIVYGGGKTQDLEAQLDFDLYVGYVKKIGTEGSSMK